VHRNMPRTLATVILSMGLSLGLATSTPAAGTTLAGDEPALGSRPAPDVAPVAPPSPGQALRRAEAALDGADGADGAAKRPEATLALRDLFVSLPRLTGEDRARAEDLLARPTDGAQDPQGDGYTVRSRKRCSTKLCVHWVSSTRDQASRKWAGRTLRVMKDVWRKEVGAMGYRRPVKDGRRGGKGGKLDVYLSDVGGDGLYGYCAPEYRLRDYPRVASGYCVLDNDFARSEFGTKPIKSLKVTAAHEFFHAVQFAYDYREDPWLMEATATWMEERFADGINDNRQYLGDSQVRLTYVPLDTFNGNRSFQYGNWVFLEFLSQRYGTGVVRRIWKQVGGFRGDGKTYSVKGIKQVLPDTTTFARTYSQFAAANVLPARSYPEGKAWPTPTWADSRRLGRNDVASGTVKISHLAANDFRLTPKAGLDRRRYRLRVSVDGPAAKSSPAATVVVLRRSGAVKRIPVRLGEEGRGTTTVPFNRKQTQRVFVVAVNASTRYRCGAADFTYSCKGDPLDDDRAFDLRFKVVD
jgi:hypothetical protein